MTDPVEALTNGLLALGEDVAAKLAKPRTAKATLAIWMNDATQRNVALGVLLAMSHPEYARALYGAWLADEDSIQVLERRTLDFMVRAFPIEGMQ